jgi:large subunit ribosomal protein L4
MQLPVEGQQSAVEVNEKLFDRPFSEALVHQVVVAYMAGGRAGTKAQKTRSQVSGGGIKPWRQKGTGRARAGTIRSPLWRTGGTTFAATPRDHSQKVNRKAYRAAMAAILSELLRQERLVVVGEFKVAEPRTKAFLAEANKVGLTRGLVVSAEVDENLHVGSRNVPGITALDVEALNPVVLVGAERVVITVDALKKIEERLT